MKGNIPPGGTGRQYMTKSIILTGGGSAGHVTPNLALIPRLLREGYDIHYIGTADGIERDLVEGLKGVTYHAISAGKLRRYASLKTLAMPFQVLAGIFQAGRVLRRVKPDVVFSKGGYVSVPVVISAACRAPVVTHESDYTPGLANRINARFADKICVTFEDTLNLVGKKGVHTGTPIRPELYSGDAEKGLGFLGFDGKKPVLLIMGGSLGAQAINDAVRAALDKLLVSFDIVHLCGSGKLNASITAAGYRQYEYIKEELPDLFAAADVMVSRAGANAVFEFLALAKPALLIPLPADNVSRGDQILNAGYFSRKGYSMVLEQKELTPQTLLDNVSDLYDRRLSFISRMSGDPLTDGTDEVLSVIREAAKSNKRKNR